MARRSGEDWYIGSIVGSDQSRTVSIALDFLASGVTYTAAIYKDGGSDAEIAYETQMVTRGTVLSIPLRKNGGLAIRITKQESAPAPPRYYRIVNRNSGKVLAVQNASLEDVASVVQWDYVDATTNDEWRLVDAGGGYYTLLNRSSGKALDVNGAVPDDGATLIQYKSRGTSNQQWQIIPTDSGYSRIVSRLSGKVIDVYDNQTTNGAQVIQWPWTGGINQQWQLVQIP